MVDLYLGDDSPLKSKKKKGGKTADRSNPPKLEYMLDFLSLMTRFCRTNAGVPPTCITPNPRTMPDIDRLMLVNPTLMDMLLADNINSKATCEIIQYFCWEDEEMSKRVNESTISSLDKYIGEQMKPYLDVIGALWNNQDSHQKSRIEYSVKDFLSLAQRNSQFPNVIFPCVTFLLERVKENQLVAEQVFINRDMWIENFFLVQNGDWVRKFRVFPELIFSFSFVSKKRLKNN